MRRKPFHEQHTIYDIALGREDEQGRRLAPKRAIFSAICSVLSLDDEGRRREILGEQPHAFAQEKLRNFAAGELEYFTGAWTESEGMSRHPPGRTLFVELPLEQQLEYMKDRLAERVNLANTGIRLASAHTRRAYFPVTLDFVREHGPGKPPTVAPVQPFSIAWYR